MTLPYAEVIGDPIAHSKSPTIHKYWLARLGMTGEYRATRVGPNGLGAYFNARRADPNWRGCNVTMPLKQAVQAFLDDVDPPARRIGSVNAVVRRGSGPAELTGHNTDWIGINLALDTDRLQCRSAAVIGTGGAARAALEELRQARIPQISILTRTRQSGLRALAEFQLSGDVLPLESAPNVDLLINASPLGMVGYPEMPVDVSRLSDGALVFDMVYHPLETRLLRTARQLGLRTVDGLSMLINQAAISFGFFFEQSAPEPFDNPGLRELLTR